MAVQLRRAGEETGLLAVLDAYPDYRHTFDDLPRLSKRQWLGLLLDDVGGRDLAAPEPAAAGAPAEEELAADLSRETGLPAHLLEGRESFPLLDIFRNDLELMRTSTPEAYAGDMLLFTADLDIPGHQRDPAHTPRAWEPYVGGLLDVHHVQGQHYHLMGPEHVAVIGPVVARRAAQPARHGLPLGGGPSRPGALTTPAPTARKDRP